MDLILQVTGFVPLLSKLSLYLIRLSLLLLQLILLRSVSLLKVDLFLVLCLEFLS
jgi:hypothetical protein